MNAGHSLVELLVAMAIALTITSGMLALFAPAHGLHATQPEIADLHQRTRVAVESLRRGLVMAGAGTANAFAAVFPYRAGEAGEAPARGVYYEPDAISVLYVPHTPAHAAIRTATPQGTAELIVDTQFNCGPLGRTALCGFDEGMRAIAFDRFGVWDAMTVSRVGPASLTLVRPGARSAHAYASRATVARVERHTYYLDVDAAANRRQLRHYDGFATDMPVVDEVVGLGFEYFGEPDPPRLRDGVSLADRDLPDPVTTYGPRPLPDAGNCIFAFADGVHVPLLPSIGAGPGLVLLPPSALQDGPWCPDAVAPDRYDADLLRIRRVRVTLRLQVASPSLRAVVPDREVGFDVALRNTRAGR